MAAHIRKLSLTICFLFFLLRSTQKYSIVPHKNAKNGKWRFFGHNKCNNQSTAQPATATTLFLRTANSEPITQWAVPHLPAMHSITWTDARSAVQLNHKGCICSLQSKRIWAAVGYSLLRWSHTKRDWRILVLTLIIGQWQLVWILENRFLVLASTGRQYKIVRILDKINTSWMWIKSL